MCIMCFVIAFYDGLSTVQLLSNGTVSIVIIEDEADEPSFTNSIPYKIVQRFKLDIFDHWHVDLSVFSNGLGHFIMVHHFAPLFCTHVMFLKPFANFNH